jgi:hypothetical protein
LDNVSVGYTFNQKPNATSLVKVTLAAQNVVLITNYSGLDPEISGGDNNLYPRPITFTLGLNVNSNTNNKKNEKTQIRLLSISLLLLVLIFHHVPVI